MPIATWWPKLAPTTQEWMVENNGSPVPVPVIEEIQAAGGPGPGDPWWIVDDDSDDVTLPDSAVDWVEQVANDEGPDTGQ